MALQMLIIFCVLVVPWCALPGTAQPSPPPEGPVPSFTRGPDVSVLEDSGPYGRPWATDITDNAGGSRSLEFVTTAANSGLFSTQPEISDIGLLTFEPAPDAFGTTLVTVFLRSCGPQECSNSPSRTFSIFIAPVNDCPYFNNRGDVTVDEDSGSVTITNWASGISRGAPNENHQRLTWTTTNNNNGLFLTQPFIEWSAAAGGGTTANLRFEAHRDAHGEALVTVRARDNGGIENGGCDTSEVVQLRIRVTPVNDPPFFTMGQTPVEVLEDSGHSRFVRWATQISPGDENERDQEVNFVLQLVNPAHAVLFNELPAIDRSGNLEFEVAPNRNTMNAQVLLYVQLRDNDPVNPLQSCSPITSCPQLRIIIRPVNDPPHYAKGPDITVWEDLRDQNPVPPVPAFSHPRWATQISPGNDIERDEEGQNVYFVLRNTNEGLFDVQPHINPSGTLFFTLRPFQNGVASVYVDIFDDVPGDQQQGPTKKFVISVLSVNNPPEFRIVPESPLRLPLNAGLQEINPFMNKIAPGPPGALDELESQQLSLALAAVPASFFEIQPQLVRTAPGLAMLRFKVKEGEAGEARLTITATDDGGNARGGVDITQRDLMITVDAENTPPTFTLAGPRLTINEDEANEGFNFANWAVNILPGTGAAGERERATQSVIFSCVVTNPRLFTQQPTISPTGTLSFNTVPNEFGRTVVTVTARDDAVPPLNSLESPSFEIIINPVNDPPFFTPGPDIVVDECPQETAGDCAHSFPAWAKDIRKGPEGTTNEDDQVLQFTVVPGAPGKIPPMLFARDPHIDPESGLLSFTLRRGGGNTGDVGGAELVVTLMDDGGVAFGGLDRISRTIVFTVRPFVPAPSFMFHSSEPTILVEDTPRRSIGGLVHSVFPGRALRPGQSASSVLSFLVQLSNPSMFSELPRLVLESPTEATLRFALAPNEFGTVELSVTLVNSDTERQFTATHTIKVLPINDPPSFILQVTSISAVQGAGLRTERVASDIMAGPANERTTQTVAFAVSCNTSRSTPPAMPLFSGAAPAIDTAGNLRFTPSTTVFGEALCAIVLKDDGGLRNAGIDPTAPPPADTSPPQFLIVIINERNHAPTFVRGPDILAFEDLGFVRVDRWATSITDGEERAPGTPMRQALAFAVVCEATEATIQFFPRLFEINPSVNEHGDLTFTSAPYANGAAGCEVVLEDDGPRGGVHEHRSVARSFSITVIAVNNAPLFDVAANATSIVMYQDAPPTTFGAWATSVLAGPAADEVATQSVSFTVSASNPAMFVVPPSVSAATGGLSIRLREGVSGSVLLTACLVDDGRANSYAAARALNSSSSRVVGLDVFERFVGANSSCKHVPLTVVRVAVDPVVGLSGARVEVLEDEGLASPTRRVVIPEFAVRMMPGSLGGTSFDDHESDGRRIVSATVVCRCTEDPAPAVNATLRHYLFVSPPAIAIRGADAVSGNGGTADNIIGPTPAPPLSSAMQVGDLSFELRPDSNGDCGGCHITVTDASGLVATSPAFTIAVLPVNDAPRFSIASLGGGPETLHGPGGVVQDTIGAQTRDVVIDIFEDSTDIVLNGWAAQIIAGPTPDEILTQRMAFSVEAAAPTRAAVGNWRNLFAEPPAIDPHSGALRLSMNTSARASRFGALQFEIRLADTGGTALGGVDRTTRVTLGDGTNAPVFLTLRIAAVDGAPSFTSATPVVVVLEDSGPHSRERWAEGIASNAATRAVSLHFEVLLRSGHDLFSARPEVDDQLGTLRFTTAPNRFGIAEADVVLVATPVDAHGADPSAMLLQSAPFRLWIRITAVNDRPTFRLIRSRVTIRQDESFILANYMPQHLIDGSQSGDNATSVDDAIRELPAQVQAMRVATDLSPGPFEEFQTLHALLACDAVSRRLFGSEVASRLQVDPVSGFMAVVRPLPHVSGITACKLRFQDDGGTADGGKDTSLSADLAVEVLPVNLPPSFQLVSSQVNVRQGEQGVTYTFAPMTAAVRGPSAPSDAIPTTAVTLTGLIRNIDAGSPEETHQVVALSFKCAGDAVRAGSELGVLHSADAAVPTWNAKLAFELRPTASGAIRCIINVTDDGGTANGGKNWRSAEVLIHVQRVNQPPAFEQATWHISAESQRSVSFPRFFTALTGGAGEGDDHISRFEVSAIVPISASAKLVSPEAFFAVAPAVTIEGSAAALSFTTSTAVGTINVTITAIDTFDARRATWVTIGVARATAPDETGSPTSLPTAPPGRRIASVTVAGSIESFSPNTFQVSVASVATRLSPVQIEPKDVILVGVAEGSIVVAFFISISAEWGVSAQQKRATEDGVLERLVSGLQKGAGDELVGQLAADLGVLSASLGVSSPAGVDPTSVPHVSSSSSNDNGGIVVSTPILVGVIISVVAALVIFASVLVYFCCCRKEKEGKPVRGVEPFSPVARRAPGHCAPSHHAGPMCDFDRSATRYPPRKAAPPTVDRGSTAVCIYDSSPHLAAHQPRVHAPAAGTRRPHFNPEHVSQPHFELSQVYSQPHVSHCSPRPPPPPPSSIQGHSKAARHAPVHSNPVQHLNEHRLRSPSPRCPPGSASHPPTSVRRSALPPPPSSSLRRTDAGGHRE